ncbi:MAG: hypothetical protein HXY23_04190 [Parvularculaceae bacterium]|nr:hypothetical protein [Parvularculaceae bacterium]
MNRLALLFVCAALGACQTPGAASLSEIQSASNWNLDDGDALAFRYQRDMRRLLVGRDIAGALGELRADGYECATGEAHEDHPDPMSQCKKSFATRACQLDWRVNLAANNAIVAEVETGFARDCVGRDRDFPAAKDSAIDDQLAPAKP